MSSDSNDNTKAQKLYSRISFHTNCLSIDGCSILKSLTIRVVLSSAHLLATNQPLVSTVVTLLLSPDRNIRSLVSSLSFAPMTISKAFVSFDIYFISCEYSYYTLYDKNCIIFAIHKKEKSIR